MIGEHPLSILELNLLDKLEYMLVSEFKLCGELRARHLVGDFQVYLKQFVKDVRTVKLEPCDEP